MKESIKNYKGLFPNNCRWFLIGEDEEEIIIIAMENGFFVHSVSFNVHLFF